MRYRLRTLMIVLALAPPVLALVISLPSIIRYVNAWMLANDGIYVDRDGKVISTNEPPPAEALVRPKR